MHGHTLMLLHRHIVCVTHSRDDLKLFTCVLKAGTSCSFRLLISSCCRTLSTKTSATLRSKSFTMSSSFNNTLDCFSSGAPAVMGPAPSSGVTGSSVCIQCHAGRIYTTDKKPTNLLSIIIITIIITIIIIIISIITTSPSRCMQFKHSPIIIVYFIGTFL